MCYLSLSQKLMLAVCCLEIIAVTPLLAMDNREINDERSIVRGDNQTDKRVDRSSSLTDKKNEILERLKNREALGRELDKRLVEEMTEFNRLHDNLHDALERTADHAFQVLDECHGVTQGLVILCQNITTELNKTLLSVTGQNEVQEKVRNTIARVGQQINNSGVF